MSARPEPNYCYLHDPAVAEVNKVQALCHCWDNLDDDAPSLRSPLRITRRHYAEVVTVPVAVLADLVDLVVRTRPAVDESEAPGLEAAARMLDAVFPFEEWPAYHLDAVRRVIDREVSST